MPRPRSACSHCTKRAVKCDRKQPRCERSQNQGGPPASADIATRDGLTVHLENDFASGYRKRPRGPRSCLRRQTIPLLEGEALQSYYQHHLRLLPEVPGRTGCFARCLAKWKSSHSSPLVDLALSATALAVYAQSRAHTDAAREASAKHGRLFRLLQTRIKALTTSSSDHDGIEACLIAMMLMERYASTVHQCNDLPFNTLPEWPANNAVMSLLKAWTDGGNEKTSQIVTLARRYVVRRALHECSSVPRWMSDASRFGARGLELDFDGLVLWLIDLQSRLAGLPGEPTQRSLRLTTILGQAQAIDSALLAHYTLLPRMYPYRPHYHEDLAGFPRKHFYSRYLHIFENPAQAAVHNHFFTVRLVLNALWLRILKFKNKEKPIDLGAVRQQLQCATNMGSLATSLTLTVPYCLGRFEVDEVILGQEYSSVKPFTDRVIEPYLAKPLLWPLTIASSLPEVDEAHRQWFRSELVELSRITGSGVEGLAPTQ